MLMELYIKDITPILLPVGLRWYNVVTVSILRNQTLKEKRLYDTILKRNIPSLCQALDGSGLWS